MASTPPPSASTASKSAGTSIPPGNIDRTRVAGGVSAPTRDAGADASISGGTRTVITPTANAPISVPFTISALADHARWLKFLVYGGYGTGKTRLVGSSVLVPGMRDVLFIDAEAGDLTIATEIEPVFREAAHKHMDVIRVSTFAQVARVQEFLKAHCVYRDANDLVALKKLEMRLRPDIDPEAPPRKYYTAIVDSLTEVETYAMYQLLGVSDRTRLDEESASPEWAEYKKNNGLILRLIRGYRNLPMHILFTASSSYVQDEQKRMLWQPALTGKLSKQCQGFMDVVAYATVTSGENGQKIHSFQTQPSSKVDAKCRFSNFNKMGWQNPTMHTILEGVGLLNMSRDETRGG